MQLQFGLDVFLEQDAAYQNTRLALVTNDAATTSHGQLSRAALLNKGFTIRKLFSPEHGIAATGSDGAYQKSGVDAVTGIPVISLYGEKLAPVEEDLEDIDLCVFDIPDVGCRFYTYLWTMTYVMEACAKYKKRFIILDRPNPIGADITKAEGPMLDEANCSSFIGRWNIPLKHGCTLAELAMYFAAVKIADLEIDVIKCAGYSRNHTAIDFPFIAPSPAIQNIKTAMLYPGLGLLEGVNINEGRGTQQPFSICGAPWINANDLCQALVARRLPGVVIKPTTFKAISPPYLDEECHGVELQLVNGNELCAVKTGIALLETVIKLYPDQMKERLYKTNVNPTGLSHLDKLLGVKDSFLRLKQSGNFNVDGAMKGKSIAV